MNNIPKIIELLRAEDPDAFIKSEANAIERAVKEGHWAIGIKEDDFEIRFWVWHPDDDRHHVEREISLRKFFEGGEGDPPDYRDFTKADYLKMAKLLQEYADGFKQTAEECER